MALIAPYAPLPNHLTVGGYNPSPGRHAAESIEAAWDLAHAEARSRADAARIVELTEALRAARSEQIRGDDPRLMEFWAAAQEAATEAEHCDVFDDLAEALGGPRRSKDYDVVMYVRATIRVTDTVSATSSDEAEQIAEAEISTGSLLDSLRENGADRWDVDEIHTSFA
ncbi:hypothetical protein ACR8AL_07505 [Clavibacter sepedonicus]|uniref:Uncharacterized protein n=1 Tax=Clavibacter sepedonicus TaxID=31964 RepID=B0RJG2_CLASE|nr:MULTISPECIES: hypothetical protein [Clavibacter]MBD5382459.1 hypothetical protein [Clavibacter sp.]OQJ45292.1 hypothetical protein B5P19_15650 [Clavibacter sepedonicus]OQJ50979.1 hypothetical protein B5P20_16285 [Clavibacter sepedonicus]UUK67211.1 hypothetical protein LRE50_15750 [Clavibacter sepedonicus]CAQ03352.1 hypothetical protein pCSL0109 [Clavibacter sepedonicus]